MGKFVLRALLLIPGGRVFSFATYFSVSGVFGQPSLVDPFQARGQSQKQVFTIAPCSIFSRVDYSRRMREVVAQMERFCSNLTHSLSIFQRPVDESWIFHLFNELSCISGFAGNRQLRQEL